jgi:hypothetical protein
MNGLLIIPENCSNKWAFQVPAITGRFAEAQFFYLGYTTPVSHLTPEWRYSKNM